MLTLTKHERDGIESGTITQLRRVVDPQPVMDDEWDGGGHFVGTYRCRVGIRYISEYIEKHGHPSAPFGKPGDVLRIREEWIDTEDGIGSIHYKTKASKADEEWLRESGFEWLPADSMPFEYARLRIKILGVLVERLSDSSHENDGLNFTTWNQDNPEHLWHTNPWVFVAEIEKA